MKSRWLLKPSFNVSEIGFGTSQLANTDKNFISVKYVPPDEARKILRVAVESGINFYDTSPDYGSSERLVGEIKKKYGTKIIVATKVGMHPNGKRDFSLTFLEKQIETSLRTLNTDCLDILQLKKPSFEDLKTGELFNFLETQKKKGKIKLSGVVVGDIQAGHLCIQSGKVDCLQILYNLIYLETKDLIDKASEKGLGVIIRSPLNSGFLSGSITSETTFDANDERSNYFSGPKFIRRLNALRVIQKELRIVDSKLLEFSLRFILSDPKVSLIIPAASKCSQIEKIINCGKMYRPFDPDQQKKITKIVSKHMKEMHVDFQNP